MHLVRGEVRLVHGEGVLSVLLVRRVLQALVVRAAAAADLRDLRGPLVHASAPERLI